MDGHGQGYHAKRWSRTLLALGVSIPIALAPLLGKLPIPFFPAMLELIPNSILGVVLSISTAAMSIVSIFSESNVGIEESRELRVARFKRSLLYCCISLLLFAIAYQMLVTRVPVLGGERFVSFVTGWPQKPIPPCLGIGAAECIARHLTFDDSLVASHFGDAQVR